jgi:hypothetical protein
MSVELLVLDGGEGDQRDTIERVDIFTRNLLNKVVSLVVAVEHPHLKASCESDTRKGADLKIVLKAVATLQNAMVLAENPPECIVVFADPEQFMGERAKIVPTPDQRSLIEYGPDDDGPIFDKTKAGRR